MGLLQPKGGGVGAGRGLVGHEELVGEEEEERDGGDRGGKVARLEGEIERLRSENLRWQQVRVCFVFLFSGVDRMNRLTNAKDVCVFM